MKGRTMRLAYYEDAMALASWAEQQGWPKDAERVREFAQTKIRASVEPRKAVAS